jgi:geranylgeranyl diphosphate synthase type II
MLYTVEALQGIFLEYLRASHINSQPKSLYEPVNYILSLGGKRLRPVLLLMAHNVFNARVESSLPAALAIEVFHNFTLLHDDIMDNAPLRRGQPTVHAKYGHNAGILSGDAMLILAYRLLEKCNINQLPDLLRIFNRFALEVCEGQQYDMDFERRDDVSIAEYLKMIELKTAALLDGALEMGALLGGATIDAAQALGAFGRNIGIAFQLQDDILDTFGSPEKFGKKVGGDIVQNKKTYLLLKAFDCASTDERKQLQAALGETDEARKIAQVTAIFDELGVKEMAEAQMQAYLNVAFAQLDVSQLPAERTQPLRHLAEQLMGREQ